MSQGSEQRDRALAQLHRDEAISRVGRTRRWVAIGTAALTASLAALASALTPGRSLGAKPFKPARAVPAAAGASPVDQPLPPVASPRDLGLRPPDQAPQAPPSQQSAPSQQTPDTSQAPAPPPPAAAPAPAPAGRGTAVSGGS